MVSAPMTQLDLYFFATALALFSAKFIERLDGGKLIDKSSIKSLGRVLKFIPICVNSLLLLGDCEAKINLVL